MAYSSALDPFGAWIVSFEQSMKTFLPNSVTLAGIVTEVSSRHSQNATDSIVVTPSGIETLLNLLQQNNNETFESLTQKGKVQIHAADANPEELNDGAFAAFDDL